MSSYSKRSLRSHIRKARRVFLYDAALDRLDQIGG